LPIRSTSLFTPASFPEVPFTTKISEDGSEVAALASSFKFSTVLCGCPEISNEPRLRVVAAIVTKRNTAAKVFLPNLFEMVQDKAEKLGRRKVPIQSELFTAAIFWQGYEALEGLVPVLRMNHRRLNSPKRKASLRIRGEAFSKESEWICLMGMPTLSKVPILIFHMHLDIPETTVWVHF
jgi:hypothetical protein